MRNHLIPAAAAAALMIASLGCEQSSSVLNAAENPAPPPTVDEIRSQTLVTVNGQAITGEMFGIYINDRMQSTPQQQKNTPQFQNQAINELINVMLLAQAATSAGMDKRPNVATALKMQRDQLLSRLALQEYAVSHQPSEEELKKSYDERYANQEGEEYKARHILVKSEDEAKGLIDEIDRGMDFAELARQHSTGPTGKNGGELGWFDGAQMVKPFAEAVKTSEPGKVIPTPVETQFGWHVIEVQEKREKQPPTFESVRQQLASDAQRQALAEYVNKLRTEANIEVNEGLAKKPKDDAAAAATAPPAEEK